MDITSRYIFLVIIKGGFMLLESTGLGEVEQMILLFYYTDVV